MENVSMTEARRNFAAIIKRAAAGEEIHLIANGYPVGVQIGPARGLTEDERVRLSHARSDQPLTVAASGEVENLIRIIERLTGEVDRSSARR